MIKPPEEQLLTGSEPWRRHATETRTLRCLKFEVDTPEYCAFVCWPFLPEPEKSCAKLLDSCITWLTARAGDTVMMRHADSTEWTKERIKVVSLFRVHPVRYNDLVVACGADWPGGVPAMHKGALGRYADGIPVISEATFRQPKPGHSICCGRTSSRRTHLAVARQRMGYNGNRIGRSFVTRQSD